jgi:hypothetical protein
LQDSPKCTQILIFGLKINHLATLGRTDTDSGGKRGDIGEINPFEVLRKGSACSNSTHEPSELPAQLVGGLAAVQPHDEIWLTASGNPAQTDELHL